RFIRRQEHGLKQSLQVQRTGPLSWVHLGGSEPDNHVCTSLHVPASPKLKTPPAPPPLGFNRPTSSHLPGESVTLTCSPPWGTPVAAGFRFSRDGGRRISSGGSDAQALSITGPEDSGLYTCAYWIRPSGREIQSPDSRLVSITVT
ncbi:unnamed protein product, partial [Caretta caretta]